jgi:hypothetical protein
MNLNDLTPRTHNVKTTKNIIIFTVVTFAFATIIPLALLVWVSLWRWLEALLGFEPAHPAVLVFTLGCGIMFTGIVMSWME